MNTAECLTVPTYVVVYSLDQLASRTYDFRAYKNDSHHSVSQHSIQKTSMLIILYRMKYDLSLLTRRRRRTERSKPYGRHRWSVRDRQRASREATPTCPRTYCSRAASTPEPTLESYSAHLRFEVSGPATGFSSFRTIYTVSNNGNIVHIYSTPLLGQTTIGAVGPGTRHANAQTTVLLNPSGNITFTYCSQHKHRRVMEQTQGASEDLWS